MEWLAFLLPSLLGMVGGMAQNAMSQIQSDKGLILQERENMITREREDNAIQRRVEDLKKAGLNPLVATSLGGAGASAQVAPKPNATFQNPFAGFSSGEFLDAMSADVKARKQREQLEAENARKTGEILDAQARETSANADIKENDARILKKVNILSTSSTNAKDVGNLINIIDEAIKKDGGLHLAPAPSTSPATSASEKSGKSLGEILTEFADKRDSKKQTKKAFKEAKKEIKAWNDSQRRLQKSRTREEENTRLKNLVR